MNVDYWRHFLRGWLWHLLMRPEQAHTAFALAADSKPDAAAPARHLAALAAERCRWDVAELWFEKVTRTCPDDADAWFNLGFARERSGQPSAALPAFGEALRLKPSQDRASYGMGLALARLGRHDEAATAFAHAVKLQPLNGDAYYQWGMALHHAKRPDDLRRVAERLAEFEPRRTRQLLVDAQRHDLLHLVVELTG